MNDESIINNEAIAALMRNIEPCSIDPVSIVRQMEEDEREESILRDMNKCGSFFRQADPSNGRKLIKYRVSCGYWRRGCLRCLDSRASEFEIRFLNCIEDTTIDDQEYLGIAQMTKKRAAEIVKKMRKSDTGYWRVPIKDDKVILFFDSLHFSELDNPELHDFTTADWKEICQTPKGSRYSGDLGRRQELEKSGLVVKIPRFRFDDDLDEKVINAAWSMALKDTEKLDPKYEVDAIEECLQIRMDAFEEAIESMKGKVVEKYRVMARVPEEKFGWKIDWHKDLSTLETKCSEEPPPGFIKEESIDFDKLKDEIWPIL